jgi:hypothetical protein
LKELLETKNKIKSLEKTIEEKNNKMGILQAKLEEKIKLIKERELQLNKEIETNMELKFKLEENKNNKELMKINEDLKYENSQLNELIKVMENKIENFSESQSSQDEEHITNPQDAAKSTEYIQIDEMYRYQQPFYLTEGKSIMVLVDTDGTPLEDFITIRMI